MSDKPRNSIKFVNIDDLKSGWHTKQHNFAKFAKELGIDRWALQSYIERTLKPGIKIFGQRHFSNIDDVAEFLLKKQRENQSKPTTSSIKPLVQPANNLYGITDAQKLNNLAKVHDFHPSLIKDALKVGAPPKSLIRAMMNESVPSESIAEFIRHRTTRKLEQLNQAKNKIVSTNRLSLKPGNKIVKAGGLEVTPPPNTKTRKMSKSPRNMKKWTMRQLLKMAKDSPEWKQITGKLKPISLQQQFKQFQSLDDAVKFGESSDNLKGVSQATYRRMIKAYHENLWKFHKTSELRNLQIATKERNRLRYEINKKVKGGVNAPKIPKSSQHLPKSSQLKISKLASGLKGAATQFGAGVAINALADKFVKPHTDAAATRLGTSLGRWAKDFDEKQLNKKNAKKKEK